MQKSIFIWLAVLCSACSGASAEVLTGIDEQAKLPYWELRTDAMSLRLVQRLPDQTRAYFAGRGFNKQHVEYIAGYCFFQSIFSNTAAAGNRHVVSYDARTWRTLHNSKEQPLMLREDWQTVWEQRAAQPAQRIAFEWSLLPTQQTYQPADYNWGMTSYRIPHGGKFDLKLAWTLDGRPHTATISNMQCAGDVYIPPAGQ